jgi:hypothetical protein
MGLMGSSVNDLRLAHGLAFADLYASEGLSRIDALFRESLAPELGQRLLAARSQPPSGKEESAFLIELAPHLEDFIGGLFGIRRELQELAERHHALAPVFTCKRLFVQRQALKAHKPEAAAGFDGAALAAALEQRLGEALTELAFARKVNAWMADEAANKADLDLAARYAAWATLTEVGGPSMGRRAVQGPRKLDPYHLVPVETVDRHGVSMAELDPHHHRHREGFALTDPGTDLTGALDQAHYCIFCHHQGKDSCSRGLKERDGSFKKSPFQVTLAGCPLEEKISEMHSLKAEGVPLGALP